MNSMLFNNLGDSYIIWKDCLTCWISTPDVLEQKQCYSGEKIQSFSSHIWSCDPDSFINQYCTGLYAKCTGLFVRTACIPSSFKGCNNTSQFASLLKKNMPSKGADIIYGKGANRKIVWTLVPAVSLHMKLATHARCHARLSQKI